MATRKRKRNIVVAVLAEAGSKSALKALQDELQKGVRKPPLRAERRPTGTLLSPESPTAGRRNRQNRQSRKARPLAHWRGEA